MRIPSSVRVVVLVAVALAALGSAVGFGQDKPAEPSRLAVVWSSADPDVAKSVCFMYTHNARKQRWFDEVTLIVWGPSARVLASDKDLQAAVRAMQADGVKVQACQACADMYGWPTRFERRASR